MRNTELDTGDRNDARQTSGKGEALQSSGLLEHSGLLASIIECLPAGIALLDPQGRFVHANQAYCEIQGYRADDLVGHQYMRMIRFAEEQSHLHDIHDAVFQGLKVRPHEVRIHRPDGRDIWVENSCRLLNSQGHSFCLVSVQEITERKQLEHGLQALATTDSLTGVANRRHFFELSRQEMLRCKRSECYPALLMIDLDQFKQLNDRYGHAAGDRVLLRFSTLVQQLLRESDLFGRLGGEEFAILLPDTDPEQAAAIAERLRAAMAAKPEWKPAADGASDESRAEKATTPSATISIGVAAVRPGESTIEAGLHRADQALYAAKKAGRNCVRRSENTGQETNSDQARSRTSRTES